MNRFSIPSTQNAPNFIGAWGYLDQQVCEDLIAYFESRQYCQRPGTAGGRVNLDHKNSSDITVSPKDIFGNETPEFSIYFQHLYGCYCDYVNQWPFLKRSFPEIHIGAFNIQKYSLNQHFRRIHTERQSVGTLSRFMAFMTYLNDVESGGCTSFVNYGVDVKPVRGLTLIWPADWTHAHCGNQVIKGEKYIVTGWLEIPL